MTLFRLDEVSFRARVQACVMPRTLFCARRLDVVVVVERVGGGGRKTIIIK